MPRVSVVDQVTLLDTKSIRSPGPSKRSIIQSSVRNRRIQRGGIDQRSAIGLTSSSGRHTLLEPVDTLNSSKSSSRVPRVLPSSSFSNARLRPGDKRWEEHGQRISKTVDINFQNRYTTGILHSHTRRRNISDCRNIHIYLF